MSDPVDPARSALMSRIRGKDSRPEMVVRRLVHAMGYRFRLHRRDLPGSPDLVFSRRKSVVFVHGCFWHRHPGCRMASTPKTRTDFWTEKFLRNIKRDAAATAALEAAGWRVLIIWECEVRTPWVVADRLKTFLGPARPENASGIAHQS